MQALSTLAPVPPSKAKVIVANGFLYFSVGSFFALIAWVLFVAISGSISGYIENRNYAKELQSDPKAVIAKIQYFLDRRNNNTDDIDEAFILAEKYYNSTDYDYPELTELLKRIKPQSSIWKSREMAAAAEKVRADEATAAWKSRQYMIKTYGEMPKKAAWKPIYNQVEDYLKKEINDPSSLDMSDCSDAIADSGYGWRTYCTFRMKNKFGGVEKYTKSFVIRKSDAYSPDL